MILKEIYPKLPMRDILATQHYYTNVLGFEELGNYGDYLLMRKDHVEIHFFTFKELDIKANYGQVYVQTDDIDALYQTFLTQNVPIHPNGHLETKVWGQREFSILDPDNNLLTFGQSV
jgi:catechol 2,3-dioxygenase-like lactoylglutathione lyase family enzyme